MPFWSLKTYKTMLLRLWQLNNLKTFCRKKKVAKKKKNSAFGYRLFGLKLKIETLSRYIWWGYCWKSVIAVFLKVQKDHQLNWNHCWFIICLIGLVCVPWGLTSSISLLDSQNHFTLVHNPFITLLDFNPNIFFFFNIRSKNCQCATA